MKEEREREKRGGMKEREKRGGMKGERGGSGGREVG